MRQLSQNIKNQLAAGTLDIFYLVRIYETDGTVLFSSTTNPFDIQLSDGRSFEANGAILSIDPPQLTTTVDREQYKISIADASLVQSNLAQSGLVGKQIEVLAGFNNGDTGVPFENAADTITLYRGRVDSVAYKITTEILGERILVITGTSPMLALDMKKGIYLSRDFIRQRNINDSCCDDIYEGGSSVVLKWGKS